MTFYDYNMFQIILMNIIRDVNYDISLLDYYVALFPTATTKHSKLVPALICTTDWWIGIVGRWYLEPSAVPK